MFTPDEIADMEIADIKMSFAEIMGEIVTTYGDDQEMTSGQEDKASGSQEKRP